jgi:hypothetical protein
MTTFLFVVFCVFIYVFFKENEKNKTINQLVKSGFNPSKTFKKSNPVVVIDTSRKEIAFIKSGYLFIVTKQIPFNNILKWEIDLLTDGKYINFIGLASSVFLYVYTKDIEEPIIRVVCPSKEYGKLISATLEALRST